MCLFVPYSGTHRNPLDFKGEGVDKRWWWRWRVSNPRPAAYESAALPTELHRHKSYN